MVSWKRFAIVMLVSLTLASCSHKAATPAATAAPAVPAEEAPAAVVAAPAQTPNAGGVDGDWQGDSGPNMPISFTIANNQVTDVHASFSQKKGSCNAFGSIGGDGPAPINNKSFTVHGKHDQFEFTLIGSLTSPTDASGTIDWKTNSDICGEVDAQLKWTAKKGAQTPDDN